MYPSSPWRGETAASRDGNFRRVPRFIQSLNEQHSQISVTFVTFTHPERILILGSGCKDPCTMFRGPSAGPGRSVVSANNLDREVKGHRKFEKRPGSFRRVFNTLERACEIWYWLIMMNRWSIMYPLSPWRGETAASRDGNFRRAPCIILIQSSNERHSQVSVTFVTFTHPERILILGSGCKDIALYNIQGSVSSSWQISGQCKQSGSRGERAWKIWT